ncbi:MAG: DNA-directed RNA polymerase subunit omega [Termitinemataceae bacterium]|nr:MAG: DNA-directed RNA polymerase subunit omega [Termitinemataceae bacterium]
MIFPLEQLIRYQGNMYEITCAASRRSYQLSMLSAADMSVQMLVEDNCGKVVSLAAQQVFDKEICFSIESENGTKQISAF